MDRREFIKKMGVASTAIPLYSLFNSIAHGSVQQNKPPNVLFIGVDDLNDWIGGFGGHPDAVTPNLDRMLQRGVKFNNAQCAAPICNPSRSALFTGLRPSTTGVYGNPQPFRFNEKSKDAVTIPQHFQHNGYYTCGSGKMYHGAFPDPFGWDGYYFQDC